jgi:hypothetical protein
MSGQRLIDANALAIKKDFSKVKGLTRCSGEGCKRGFAPDSIVIRRTEIYVTHELYSYFCEECGKKYEGRKK